jgi:O-antigen/teichoic acid export membrane protein
MFSRSQMKELISFGFQLFTMGGLWRLSEASGIFIVGVLLGPASAAYYSIAESVSRKTARLSRSVSTVLMPVASQLNTKNRKYELTQLLVLIPRLFLTMALLVTIVFLFMGRSFIDLWMGAGYSGQVYPLICVLCLAIAAAKAAGGLVPILTGMGCIRVLIFVRGLEAVLMIALAVPLCFQFGLIGIAWASFCARSAATVGITTTICKELEYPYVRFVRDVFFPAVFAEFPSLAAAYAIVTFFPTNQLYILIGQMLSVGMIGVMSTFIVCIPASLRQSIVSACWPQKSPATPNPGDHLTHGPYD